MNFDWSQLAFDSKKPINKLNAIFIAAPREISPARFTQLVKTYLPTHNIVLGLAKESHVQGLENQSQFKMLEQKTVQPIIDKVAASSSPHKIYTLAYFQRELPFILGKLQFAKVLFVNGSWHLSFHMRPEYYVLANRRIDYELISPFTSEKEAREYVAKYAGLAVATSKIGDNYTPTQMMEIASETAKNSFDHTFQTGVALGKKSAHGYQLLATAYNDVAPYQTHAMHFGSEREKHFSPPGDLNYYDTVHAETALLIAAQRQRLNLAGTTLFINLLPCRTCARMLSQTDIAEVVYTLDHSEGYALKLFELTGKKVRLIDPRESDSPGAR